MRRIGSVVLLVVIACAPSSPDRDAADEFDTRPPGLPEQPAPPGAPVPPPQPPPPPVAPQEDPWTRAAARGVTLRAIGQEPGWYLEIEPHLERLTFVYDYGETRAVTPLPAPDSTAGRVVYDVVTEAHSLRVVIEDRDCQDVMSGERFPLTVTVTLGDRRFDGCGRRLRPSA